MQDSKHNYTNSINLWEKAQDVFVGGVNSPVRAFKAVGGTPVFIQKAQAAYLWDVDDQRYIDYMCGWGAIILGHAPSSLTQTLDTVAKNGVCFGAPTILATQLATTMRQHMPHLRKIRFANSGTEATMTAIRIARAATNRDLIIKFSGQYHGHHNDALGTGATTTDATDLPAAPGVPRAASAQARIAEFNDIASVKRIFAAEGTNIAAVIVEPIAGNMNMIAAEPAFLQALRDLTTQHKSILIFDEVMTGFRVALGGAQSLYQIEPDLTTLGKVIGGGLPIGAIGGRADLMNLLAPSGPVSHAGTFSANPATMASGLAALNQLTSQSYETLSQLTQQLTQGLQQLAAAHEIGLQTHAAGGMFGFIFTESRTTIQNYSQISANDNKLFATFFHKMLARGVYFAPSPLEAGFLTLAHTSSDIDYTLNAAAAVFAELKQDKV